MVITENDTLFLIYSNPGTHVFIQQYEYIDIGIQLYIVYIYIMCHGDSLVAASTMTTEIIKL